MNERASSVEIEKNRGGLSLVKKVAVLPEEKGVWTDKRGKCLHFDKGGTRGGKTG